MEFAGPAKPNQFRLLEMCRVGKGRFLAVPTAAFTVGTAKKRPLPTLRFLVIPRSPPSPAHAPSFFS